MLRQVKILQPNRRKLWLCDYSVYRPIVNEMKQVTQQIVDAYFNCAKRDCEPDIMAAHKKYGTFVGQKFAPFLRCSFTYYTPECVDNIKHATYFSAENILSTLIECARFKASGQRPDFRILINELLNDWLLKKNNTVVCNCVKIVNYIFFPSTVTKLYR